MTRIQLEPRYECFKVPEDLQKYILKFWVLESDSSGLVSVFPCGSTELTLHFGDRFIEIGSEKEEKRNFALLTGQLTKPKFFRPTGSTGILGVTFSPLGFSAFCRSSCGEINDLNLEAREVLDPDPSYLCERFINLNNRSRVALMTSFLRGLLREDSRFLNNHSYYSLHMRNLVQGYKTVGVSRRTFERQFVQLAGISPKKLMRIQRAVLAAGSLGASQNILDVVVRLGYYDQSHLINECKQFFGTSPRNLALRVQDDENFQYTWLKDH